MRTSRTKTGKEAGSRLVKASGVPPLGSAFSRPDLLAGIGAVVLLAALFAFNLTGERGRIARCKHKLRTLGDAMQEYASSHAGALPPASIAPPGLTWDSQIMPYLPPKVVGKGVDHAFQCPSDNVVRSRPRSYAMSAHDMQPENWPPGPDNVTGVGLVWNQGSMDRLLDEGHRKMAATNLDSLAMMKRAFIPVPSSTLVLTESINSENNLKGTEGAAIGGPGPQLEVLLQNKTRIHGGSFNYLMLDGHVELQLPLQAGMTSGGMNIWNINKAN
jgi:prepilin-type processing-associated H-X9-DG protein